MNPPLSALIGSTRRVADAKRASAMTRTEHVGIGSGWVLRLIVRDGVPLLYAHGAAGGWLRVAKADAIDLAWLRSSRWTPLLPEGVRWP